eukprot:3977403-Pleurochrysis_carterae.AAC.2
MKGTSTVYFTAGRDVVRQATVDGATTTQLMEIAGDAVVQFSVQQLLMASDGRSAEGSIIIRPTQGRGGAAHAGGPPLGHDLTVPHGKCGRHQYGAPLRPWRYE